MKTRNVLSYISCLFLVFLPASCGDAFNDLSASNTPTPKDPNKGLVAILISDGNAGQRTLLPSNAGFSRYALNFTREGKETVSLSSTDSAVEVELESGAWELTVNAYLAIQGTDCLAARGSKTITVAAGASTSASITIAADRAGEEGTFSYDIRLSLDTDSLTKALLVLESLDAEYKTEIDLKEEGAERGRLAVKPGFYLLKVQLENAYQAAGKTDVVHIYTNMETKAEYAFKSGDFTRLIPLSGVAQVITNSGVAQKKVSIFLYRDEEYEDLITYTEVDLPGTAWETAIPEAYDKVYFKLGVEDEAGFFFSKVAGNEDIPKIGKIDIALNVVIPEPRISSFSISAAESGIDAPISGAIDEESSRITLASHEWIERLDSLKAAFEASGAVTVNGARQESGETAQDFRSDIVYTVTAEDNAAKDYTVVFESPQTTGLPVIKIDTQGGVAIDSKEIYVYTNIAIIDPNNATNNVELTGYKDRIRGRGNATWTYPKKPYKIKLDKKTNMLGMGSDKDWVLLANYCDKTLLRTAIAFKLSEALGFPWTPKARFVELFLNGEYMGNYQLVEGIKQGNNRVDIPETGYIVERDGYYLSEPKYFVTNGNYGYSFKNPDTDDLTDSQWNYIKNYLNEFESVLDSASFNDSVNGYSKYIDTESFGRWFLFHNILANMDTNPFLVKADDAYATKLLMGPVWDFEWSLGIGWYDGARPRPADYWVQNGWYFSKLLIDDAFAEKLRELWDQNKTSVRQDILQFIDDTKDEIAKSQVENFKRWNIMNDRVSVGGIPLGSFEAEVACDRQFFINHMDWLDTAINGL